MELMFLLSLVLFSPEGWGGANKVLLNVYSFWETLADLTCSLSMLFVILFFICYIFGKKELHYRTQRKAQYMLWK